MMKMKNTWIAAAGLVLALAGSGVAEEILITEFRDGHLTFTNDDPALYYRVEFKPNLTDPDVEWDGSYTGLRNIQSEDLEITVPVGVFYRVVAHAEPFVGGTATSAHILAGHTAYVGDVQVTGEMTNVGQQTITPGAEALTISAGYHDGSGVVAGDANLVPGNIKKDVSIFGVMGSYEGEPVAGNSSIPRTGQTESYRAGDDGAHLKGVVWPSPRFEDNGNGTVTDLMTGLVWVKAPHDLAGNAGARTWNASIDFANGLTYAGRSDWRLPNVRELQSLIDFGRHNPALPADQLFAGIEPTAYWSSTTLASSMEHAFAVDLVDGAMHEQTKMGAAYAWPVRRGEDEPFVFLITTNPPPDPVTNRTDPLTGEYEYILTSTGTGFDFTVDWGDGTVEQLTEADAESVSAAGGSPHGRIGWRHEYAQPGDYEIRITGTFPRIQHGQGTDAYKLTEIRQWGSIAWDNMHGAFWLCRRLHVVGDALVNGPNTRWVTDWHRAFTEAFPRAGTKATRALPPLDTREGTDMGRMFYLSGIVHAPAMDTGKNWNFHNFFRDSRELETVHPYDISSALTTYRMFRNTQSLPYTEAMNLDTSHVAVVHMMYADRPLQTEIPGKFSTAGVENNEDVWSHIDVWHYGTGVFAGRTDLVGVAQRGANGGLLAVRNRIFEGVERPVYMFRTNPNLTEIENVSFPDATNVSRLAENCTALRVLEVHAPNAFDIRRIAFNCPALREVELTIHPHAFGLDGDPWYAVDFSNYANLEKLILHGYREEVRARNCKLNRAAIMNLIDSLGTITSGTKPVYVQGNPGASEITQADINTAAAKGWVLHVD